MATKSVLKSYEEVKSFQEFSPSLPWPNELDHDISTYLCMPA